MHSISRRQFLQWSSALGGSVATATLLPLPSMAESKPSLPSKTYDHVKWAGCTINCGSKCPVRVFVKNGKIDHIESDNTGDDVYGSHQIRACLRGRSNRFRVYNPNRLLYPLKRVGKRGEGKFVRISWDEALESIATKMKEIKEKYGNEAILIPYATGTTGAIMNRCTSGPWMRLFSQFGGYLNYHNSYSTGQIANGLKHFYGTHVGSDIMQIEHAKLVVMFGNNPVETRMSGGGTGYAYKVALEKSGAKIIHIDPRYSDSLVGACDQWIPIVPGTDGALVAAMAYVMISENLHDEAFLKKYCIGFSADTLPEGAPKNGSYEDYVMGKGDDGIAKTPAWAETITQIPAQTIIDLAREIATTKPCYIAQGWGAQRHSNGEQAARAIAMLAIMSGNIGIEGTSTGGREHSSGWVEPAHLPFKNPIKDSVPCFLWTDAIVRGKEMKDITDGIRNTQQLKQNVKFILNTGGNCLLNQHSDIHATSKILEDESLCEFIVDVNVTRTSSNSFADIILPDATPLEQEDFVRSSAGYSNDMPYIIYSQKAIEPVGECMSVYDMCTKLAEKLGGESFKQSFTEGRTQVEWLEHLWNLKFKDKENMPSFAQMKEMGLYRLPQVKKSFIAHEKFIQNPEENPLKTPTGKIEIYSTTLAKMAQTWILKEGQKITPLPEFTEAKEGPLDPLRKTYPLQLFGYHYKGRTHSSFWESAAIREINPNELWMNPIDAKERGIQTGDDVLVFNGYGKILLKAKVTPKIMPHVTTCPQGGWYKNKNGIDVGGCINTLTNLEPTAIAKANPQHSILVEIEKYRG
ncbi:DMSO/selenate family reductase complex A subunit [Sulfurospirillum barnesii]|uniref:Anaerobic dimethyl sulfoxide reductase, A subunit, DmsA/YnfE family n=1 Tax=Sulfurospirillum barnesii (strain ATCC 700032 / DSM 10660 / SES-3) TaxID=760154 RepID=I3XW77_SULBS|nr:DMSO/selenate family reductase complex A subunit [Sulfurospirillum barnesii]AFL68201.1 anaerobic dimethyl sulfoxide reductase, A subunit, DmsA/YnfE family [Sulfurospirillum barnesii SES-3]